MKTQNLPIWKSERPRKKRNPVASTVDNKWSRYKKKLVAEGRCPHCGEPCAPYYECQLRRSIKRINHTLSKFEKAGEIVRVRRGVYQKTASFIPLTH